MTIAVREVTNRRLTSFQPTFDIFDRRGLRQLADPVTFNYYAATLLEVFGGQDFAGRIEDPARQGELDEGMVAKLAACRAARDAADLERW